MTLSSFQSSLTLFVFFKFHSLCLLIYSIKYRLGGGAASSVVGGQNSSDLDFSAVQRGDAQMGQKLNRVVRGCIPSSPPSLFSFSYQIFNTGVELDVGGLATNPIVSIHDQGAGGAGNVLKEIVDPLGAKIEVDKFVVGDPTLSVLEIWGAEYQEQVLALFISVPLSLMHITLYSYLAYFICFCSISFSIILYVYIIIYIAIIYVNIVI